MRCEQIQSEFVDYLDETLGDGDRDRVEAHVAECPACRARLRRLEDGHTAVRQTSSRLAPADTYLTTARRDRLMEAYSGKSRPTQIISFRTFVAAAAIAVILTSVSVLIPDMIRLFSTPSPPQVADRNSGDVPALTPLVVTSPGEGARPRFFPVRVHRSLQANPSPPERPATDTPAAEEPMRTHPEWVTVPAENVYYDESEAAHWW